MSKEKRKNHSEELLHATNRLIKRIQKADETEATEAEASFRIVMERVSKEKMILSQRRIYRWATTTAAVIAIGGLLGYLYTINNPLPTTSAFDIALLDQNPSVVFDNEVTLITDQNTMNLKDSTSLEYDQTGTSNAQQHLLNKINQVTKSKNKTHQIIVPKGKRANVTLCDGTKIYINSGSKIIYPELFEGDRREVLVEGEVYLEVAPNKKCPFIVKTRHFDIEVLGTAFNICAYREDKASSVVLVHGSVEVTTENKTKTELKPNELMSLHGNQTSVCQVNVSEYISWIDNQLLMERRSLSQIFAKLERYYGCTISCSEEVASMSISGKLDLHSSLTHVMDNLCLLLSLNYTINAEQQIVINIE